MKPLFAGVLGLLGVAFISPQPGAFAASPTPGDSTNSDPVTPGPAGPKLPKDYAARA